MEILLGIIALIISFKNLFFFRNLFFSKIFIAKRHNSELTDTHSFKNILLLIPVLREQNIILHTLEYFRNLKIRDIKLSIVLVGTVREDEIKNGVIVNPTMEIIENWINKLKQSKDEKTQIANYYYTKANDYEGDRASQLNYGMSYFKNILKKQCDIIGVYDADSLPNIETLNEVCNKFQEGFECCQQPVHFIDATLDLVSKKTNPIIVANALYQTTWTMIRELPVWYKYSLHSRKKTSNTFKENIYLIGHGEFISNELYDKFKFPENQITDGIQLGYRLGMCNRKITPLNNFCSDDVPKTIGQLIQQHKRWFGGCMRLYHAYKWSKNNSSYKATLQYLHGYWSQALWAFAAPICVLSFIASLFLENEFWRLSIAGLIFLNMLIYTYMLPLLSHSILGSSTNIKFWYWLWSPIAILLKCIGPNLYIAETFWGKIMKNYVVKYGKVER